MESMNELMQALQDAHSLSGFLKFTLRRLLDLSRARGAFVLQNLGDRLAIRASANSRSSQVIDGEKLIVLPLVQKVFNTQRPIAISDLVRDPHLGDLGSLLKGGYRSLLILPYQSPAESGVIYLLDPLPREGKLEDDLVFYNFFANLISLAIMQLESVRVVEVSEVAD